MSENYTVITAPNGKEGLQHAVDNIPDLIISDVMMPVMDGLEMIRKIKENNNICHIPIIVLSAKALWMTGLAGLEQGIDDYITKPFETKELLARITVQLRNSSVSAKNTELMFEELRLNTETYQVSADGMTVRLTKTEFAVLKLLMQNPSQVITKARILDLISEDTPDCMESSLKVHVSNLRRKLREITGKDYIESCMGNWIKMREQ